MPRGSAGLRRLRDPVTHSSRPDGIVAAPPTASPDWGALTAWGLNPPLVGPPLVPPVPVPPLPHRSNCPSCWSNEQVGVGVGVAPKPPGVVQFCSPSNEQVGVGVGLLPPLPHRSNCPSCWSNEQVGVGVGLLPPPGPPLPPEHGLF